MAFGPISILSFLPVLEGLVQDLFLPFWTWGCIEFVFNSLEPSINEKVRAQSPRMLAGNSCLLPGSGYLT